MPDMDKTFKIKHNIYSIYGRVSTGFVLLIMVLLAVLSTIIVPFELKEYSIPAILRLTNDNMFFSTMRIRTLTYFGFLICAGCLPHLSFYIVRADCLHTSNPDPFGLVWTDRYFYSLVTLMWFVAMPLIMYFISSFGKDQTKFLFVPLMVAGMIFGLLIVVFGSIVIVFALFDANDIFTQVSIAFCIFVLLYSFTATLLYRIWYSERDLMRIDEEELSH